MADIKITGYAELAAPISTDLVEVVSDPGGTPISKKVQIRNLFKGGGQIAFPATAVPSADPNTMDDYEEGTYTITITPSTSGTITLKAAFDLGAYTKIGRVVHVQGLIQVNSVNSPVGYIKILIPFAIADLAEYAEVGIGNALTGDVDLPAGAVGIALASTTTSVYCWPRCPIDNAGYQNIDAALLAANNEIQFSYTYFI